MKLYSSNFLCVFFAIVTKSHKVARKPVEKKQLCENHIKGNFKTHKTNAAENSPFIYRRFHFWAEGSH